MSGEERVPGRRRLDAQERALWSRLTETVAPLAGRRSAGEHDDGNAGGAPGKASARTDTPAGRRAATGSQPAAALAPLDRRLKQRLARGTESIHDRLDLHGRTQAAAHAELLRFLRAAREQGGRFVLVITGKGTRADESGGARGILQRQVPLWLQLPEFRPYVVGFEKAHVRHGGEGALYVRLRRRRSA